MKPLKQYTPINSRPTSNIRASNLRRLFSRYRFWIVVPLSIILVWLVIAWSESGAADSVAKVSEVEVHGDGRFVSVADVNAVVEGKLKGKNIYLIKQEDVQKLIKSNFLAIKDVEVIKEGSSKIVISIKERTPIVILSVGQPEAFYLTDIEGYVLGVVDPTELRLPVVKYNKPDIKIGSFLEKSKVDLYVKIIDALRTEDIKVSTFVSDESFLSFYTENNVLVYISFDKDIRTSAKLLKEVLLKFKLENIILKKVDLRYDNVVVEY